MNFIWHSRPTADTLNKKNQAGLCEHLGIEFLEVGDDFLKARMPVDCRNGQPMGILHGGASCALAETIGSVAANYCVDHEKYICVGLELNINHIRSVSIESGSFVTAVAKPLHIGKTTQVWDIQIYHGNAKLIAISRLTIAVLTIKKRS